ncbi:hypothetical protein AAFF_G00393600 [Aldrovandia affinis]|uniref:Uncharacterized protein n=1 Tax=Aldrovandia affinis TaxID=143900 RepID=A0AAD7SDH5_9TELE|nr:hypothetical protein AAFF_G00393600 [Aldrovandia affinis]
MFWAQPQPGHFEGAESSKSGHSCRGLPAPCSGFFEELEEKTNQAALKIPQEALIHDVVTQRGATHKMLTRFTEQQQVVCAPERGPWHLMPKYAHIGVMEQVYQLLGPLSELPWPLRRG